MKVLHVIPSISEKSGGPGHAILPMCRSLCAERLDVSIATTDEGISSLEGLKAGETVDYKGVTVTTFPAQIGKSFKYSRPFGDWLSKNINAFDLVHIHAIFNHASIAAARACQKSDVPYVVRPLGTLVPWAMDQKPWRKRIFWQGVGKNVLTRAAAIHYTSHAEKESTERSLRLQRGVVVPLGVSMVLQTEHAPFLRGAPYVLVLSRLLPTKGIDGLIDSFLSLVEREEFREWRLVLAGDGPPDYVASLKRKVMDNLASDFVIFSGWLDGEKKAATLANAALLALPSQHENFGLCVMEALAAGVPVLISPNVNLAPEIAAAGAGWVSHHTQLPDTLASALRSPAERTLRGSRGRELAKNYSWDRIAQQLRDLYLEITLGSADVPSAFGARTSRPHCQRASE